MKAYTLLKEEASSAYTFYSQYTKIDREFTSEGLNEIQMEKLWH